jgi:hypothetical protein
MSIKRTANFETFAGQAFRARLPLVKALLVLPQILQFINVV